MSNVTEKQDFGSNPLDVRDTNHYTSEYVESVADKWDQLIDWESRSESEGNFFIEKLKERGVHSVLDAAAGTGFHSVRLLKAGFDVSSVDGAPQMLVKAFDNAKAEGFILRTVQSDWRSLTRDIHGRFDAVICLGNSFTHLFSEQDRRKTLAEFYSVLKHDGVLILDQRNYDAILDDGFSNKHTYYYCGENIKAEPEHVDEGLARFVYTFPDESVFNLNMFPLRKDYTRRLLDEAGFQNVTTFGDFHETYRNENDPDYFIHIASKTPARDEKGE